MLALQSAFPSAAIHTTVYDRDGTYNSFRRSEVVTSPLQRVGPIRRDPRVALPLLASATSRLRVDADVTICSTTGWAHGVQTSRREGALRAQHRSMALSARRVPRQPPGAGPLPARAAGALAAEMGSPRRGVGRRRARELRGDAGTGA